MKTRLTLLLLIGILYTSCKQSANRAFYYWKSVYDTNPSSEKLLNDLKVKKLYIRFFDVDWYEADGVVAPKAKIRFTEKLTGAREVVPVVYIVNRSLQKTGAIKDLAARILKLTDEIASNNHIRYEELQIDCDWTDNTKEKFFALLSHLKTLLNDREIIVSSTIRLHQVKYKQITGIPPVDRGMLMYYNMGKITAFPSENSIFNIADAEKYNHYIADYPLPLDVALPVFSWGIHIRNGEVIELLNNMRPADFENKSGFTKQQDHMYVADKSFFYRGFYFMEGDEIKTEEITPKECEIAAKQLNNNIKKAGTVALFHLDSLTISRYEKKNFEKVFSYFH